MRGPCVRARAPGECVEWSFLRNLARVRFHPGRCCCWWGRNSARPRNGPPRRPRDSLIHVATLTNAVFALPYPAAAAAATADHPLGPSTSAPSPLYISLSPAWLSLVLPPSRRGSRSQPIKTLYDHVVPAQRPPPLLRLLRLLLFLIFRGLFLFIGLPLLLILTVVIPLLFPYLRASIPFS